MLARYPRTGCGVQDEVVNPPEAAPPRARNQSEEVSFFLEVLISVETYKPLVTFHELVWCSSVGSSRKQPALSLLCCVVDRRVSRDCACRVTRGGVCVMVTAQNCTCRFVCTACSVVHTQSG